MVTKAALVKKICALVQQELNERHKQQVQYDWSRCARPEQRLPDGDWKIWFILAGRGFGKTRAGSEAIRHWATSGRCRRMALIGQTESDVEQVMIHGESGLLRIHPESERPHYQVSKKCLLWPNGATATLYSAESYEKLRGPQFDGAWIDELAKYRQPEKVWEQLMFSLRLGENPQVIVTTTPRPLPLLKRLLAGEEGKMTLTRGTTFDNAANLSPSFLQHMKKRYGKNPLGRQELEGEILERQKGALWSWRGLEKCRQQTFPDLDRLILAVDPAVTSGQKSDETGIILAGRSGSSAYVLKDISGRYTPSQWTKIVIDTYKTYKVDKVVAEVNQGGDLVEQMLRASAEGARLSFKAVRATRGKRVRAEPIANLYEQGLVHHVGDLASLEEQLCSYDPLQSSQSPDRLDALVWALTELMLENQTPPKKVWAL